MSQECLNVTTIVLFAFVYTDGKVYDAYMMCYKSDTDSGMGEEDRRWLEKVLEEQFGYKLCLHDRDVLPGEGMSLAPHKDSPFRGQGHFAKGLGCVVYHGHGVTIMVQKERSLCSVD